MQKLLETAERRPDQVAVEDQTSVLTYGQLLDRSAGAASALLQMASVTDLDGARVVFLVAPGVEYARLQWAIWRAGGIAVPLSPSQPAAEWDYIIGDTGATLVIGDAAHGGALRAVAEARWARFADAGATDAAVTALPGVEAGRAAMILYTSGTTSLPKGVVITHANLEAQMAALLEAWAWSPADRVLHVLPLHHVHGIVNVLGCALRAGATCEFLSPFQPHRVWERLAAGGVTLFMAVPTIYAKLLAAWEAADAGTQDRWSSGARSLRLMVSGSAALPETLLERWRRATGHVLLERYGMTEIGMALSNPLHGERRPGHVGVPLPGVELRLVDEDGAEVPVGTAGEIEVRGAGVFSEYWERPESAAEAFRDGWFRSGDVAVIEEGSYRILGRRSVDIMKTGGHKVSALEIEEVLRQHPDIRECAVVGVPDEEWGERVAAALELREGASVDLASLREWASSRLARYKIPTLLQTVAQLPRNAMGKVVKSQVKRLFT